MVIIGCWKGVISGAFFIISVLLNTIFTLLFANAIYLGVMRFISVEKFQRVMSYAQVVLIAGVALSYQLVGRLHGVYSWICFTRELGCILRHLVILCP